MTSGSSLRVRDLALSLDGVQALRQINFAVNDCELVGIYGPNRSGKSEIAGCVSGVIAPSAGSVLFDGRELTGLSILVRRELGIVCCPENKGIFPSLSVRDSLEVGIRHLPAKERLQRLERVFDQYPFLASRLRQGADTLSGGEAQLLAIARRVIVRPRLFVVDEPFGGLAPKAVEAVIGSLDALRREGTAILLLDVNGERLRGCANRVYSLEDGVLRKV